MRVPAYARIYFEHSRVRQVPLYGKIYREDILVHAYAQCRASKGAPGVDDQDFADVGAYGRERSLGELALVLREETCRPDPIRRVCIPKASSGSNLPFVAGTKL